MATPRQTLDEIRRSVERFQTEAQKLIGQVRTEGPARLRDEADRLLARVEDHAARLRKQLAGGKPGPRSSRKGTTRRRTTQPRA